MISGSSFPLSLQVLPRLSSHPYKAFQISDSWQLETLVALVIAEVNGKDMKYHDIPQNLIQISVLPREAFMAWQNFPQWAIYIPALSSVQFLGDTQKNGFEQERNVQHLLPFKYIFCNLFLVDQMLTIQLMFQGEKILWKKPFQRCKSIRKTNTWKVLQFGCFRYDPRLFCFWGKIRGIPKQMEN